MSTDCLQLDHLKLCTGNIDTHLLEFDHIMITSPTHSFLGTYTDMYRHVDKAIEKCNYYFGTGDGGGTVVKVLCYKSEGRWFNPRWCHWNFSLT